MKPKREFWYDATVVRVIDGDSVVLSLDLGWKVFAVKQECRICGPGGEEFDAPEWNTPEGDVAKKWLIDLLAAGTAVVVRTFKARKADKYKRWLAAVYVTDGNDAGYDVATGMVADGLGKWVAP